MANIACNIDVTKIDKTKFFHGKKGTYMDLVLIETPDSQYGNQFMCVQGVTKEDRAAGVKGAILGNAKFLEGAPASRPAPQEQSSPPPPPIPEPEPMTEDVPF